MCLWVVTGAFGACDALKLHRCSTLLYVRACITNPVRLRNELVRWCAAIKAIHYIFTEFLTRGISTGSPSPRASQGHISSPKESRVKHSP